MSNDPSIRSVMVTSVSDVYKIMNEYWISEATATLIKPPLKPGITDWNVQCCKVKNFVASLPTGFVDSTLTGGQDMPAASSASTLSRRAVNIRGATPNLWNLLVVAVIWTASPPGSASAVTHVDVAAHYPQGLGRPSGDEGEVQA